MNKKLVSTMTKTVDPNSKYDEAGDSTISRLLNCQTDFADRTENLSKEDSKRKRLGKIVSSARDAKIENVIKEFENAVIVLLRMDKKEQIILALLDIIEKDATINNKHEVGFKKYFGKTKKDQLSQDEYVLSDFLARIFLYTAAEVDNKEGETFIEAITDEYIADFEKKRDVIKVWETTAFQLIQGNKDKTPSEKMLDIFKPAASECGIKKVLENEDSEGSVDVERFIDIIYFKIEPIETFKNQIKYSEIMEFVQLLEEFEIAVKLEETLLYGLKSANDKINDICRRIKDLYSKIIGEDTDKDIPQNGVSVEDEGNLKIFNDAICKFGIKNFLKMHSAFWESNSDWILKVEDFIKTINKEIPPKSVHIIEFIYKLDEYKEYLQNNTCIDDDKNLIIKVNSGEPKEVLEIVDEIFLHCQLLNSLYKKICGVDLSLDD